MDKKNVPAPSVSRGRAHIEEVSLTREQVHALIKQHDDHQLWDGMKAKDIDPGMIRYVQEQLEAGFDFTQIRRQIGIRRATDKSWQKIMSALKQGFRIDGPAFLVSKAWEYQTLSRKLLKQINTAIDEGVDVVVKNGKETEVVKVQGPSKELAMTIDTYNRLNQGFVKLGQDLGAFVDHEGKAGPGGAGVVIQINSNIALPSQAEVDAHRQQQTIVVQSQPAEKESD